MLTHAQLLVMLLTVLMGIVSIIGFVLWAAKHAYEERRRLRCPLQRTMATVLFELAPDGRRTDVLRCSLVGNTSLTRCGKPCLHATAK
jgi:hypothetical protein